MAKVVPEIPKRERKAQATYPYDDWFQLSANSPGSWVELVRGEDFVGEVVNMYNLLNLAAVKRELMVQVTTRQESVYYRLVQWEAPEADLPAANADEHD